VVRFVYNTLQVILESPNLPRFAEISLPYTTICRKRLVPSRAEMTLPCTTFCRNGSGATDYRKRPTGPYHIPRVTERARCQGLQELDTIYHVLQKAPGATDCRKLPTMYHALQKVVSCSAFSRLHPYTISRRNGRRGVAELVCINRNGVSQDVMTSQTLTTRSCTPSGMSPLRSIGIGTSPHRRKRPTTWCLFWDTTSCRTCRAGW
jgi:hypothetical protein